LVPLKFILKISWFIHLLKNSLGRWVPELEIGIKIGWVPKPIYFHLVGGPLVRFWGFGGWLWNWGFSGFGKAKLKKFGAGRKRFGSPQRKVPTSSSPNPFPGFPMGAQNLIRQKTGPIPGFFLIYY